MGDDPESLKQQLVERARELVPLLAEEAQPSEALRQPSDRAMDAIEGAELFKLMVPRCYGGFELDMDAFVDVVLTLSEGDASLSWVTSFLIEHNWMLCLFPEAFQKEVFRDRSYVLAPGMIAPTGKATPTEGGVRLDGRWQFATGISRATWIIAGGIVHDENGSFDPRFFAVPREQVRVEDTWHVDGMCGTGSHDVVIEDLFVPHVQSVSILEMNKGTTPGSRIHAGPLYRTPMLPLLCTAASMPSVGTARACARVYAERLPSRKRMGFGASQSERPHAQARLARVTIGVDQAELLLRDTVRDLCALRETASPSQCVQMQARLSTVMDQCRGLIGEICAASGASAHHLHDPLQRARRDAEVMACHVAFDLERNLQNAGRVLLGLDPEGPLA